MVFEWIMSPTREFIFILYFSGLINILVNILWFDIYVDQYKNPFLTKCVFDLLKTLKLQTLDDEIKSFENKLQQDVAGKFERF